MNDDLKEVLEAIREENAEAHAETRRRFETLAAKFETAQAENAAAHVETRRLFEAEQLKNTAAHIKTREHAELIAESYQHKLDLVVERVLSNGEKIDQLEAKVDHVISDHESRIARLEISASLQGQI